MQVIVPTQSAPLAHPIELMQRFVAANEWRLHHASPSEISVEIPGHWSDYTLNLTWQAEHAALHINVLFDIFIVDGQIPAAREVVATMNAKIWMGHFDLLTEDGSVAFRHTLPLRGTGGATPEQIEDLIDITMGECERGYPALFQIATGGVSPHEAIAAAFMKTLGTA